MSFRKRRCLRRRCWSPHQEYEDVLIEEEASSSAAPASGSRLQPKPKKRPKPSPGHGEDSSDKADRPTDPTDPAEPVVVKDAVKAASKPSIWFDEFSLPPVSTVRQTGTGSSGSVVGSFRIAPISAARREACRSGWPGWRYAAPARVPGIRGGRARAWRVGQMASADAEASMVSTLATHLSGVP